MCNHITGTQTRRPSFSPALLAGGKSVSGLSSFGMPNDESVVKWHDIHLLLTAGVTRLALDCVLPLRSFHRP